MLNGVSQDERQAWERFVKVYRDPMCEFISRTGKAGRRSHRGTCGFVCCWCVASCATRGRDAPAPCGDRFMGPRAETDSWGKTPPPRAETDSWGKTPPRPVRRPIHGARRSRSVRRPIHGAPCGDRFMGRGRLGRADIRHPAACAETFRSDIPRGSGSVGLDCRGGGRRVFDILSGR